MKKHTAGPCLGAFKDICITKGVDRRAFSLAKLKGDHEKAAEIQKRFISISSLLHETRKFNKEFEKIKIINESA